MQVQLIAADPGHSPAADDKDFNGGAENRGTSRAYRTFRARCSLRVIGGGGDRSSTVSGPDGPTAPYVYKC